MTNQLPALQRIGGGWCKVGNYWGVTTKDLEDATPTELGDGGTAEAEADPRAEVDAEVVHPERRRHFLGRHRAHDYRCCAWCAPASARKKRTVRFGAQRS
jgi:hypothetical protein